MTEREREIQSDRDIGRFPELIWSCEINVCITGGRESETETEKKKVGDRQREREIQSDREIGHLPDLIWSCEINVFITADSRQI